MKSNRTNYDFLHPRSSTSATSTTTIPTNIICHLQNHYFPITDLQCHMDVLQKKDWSQLTARLLDTTTSACSPSGDRLASNLVVVASTRIMTDAGKCIGELVANAIDASATNGAAPIGRFGMGFFACLGLLYKHPLRTIHVHSMRGPDSFLLSIRYNDTNDIYEARIIPAASSCAPGTVVSIDATGRDQFTVQETDQIRQSLKGFQFISRVRFRYGQSQDQFIHQRKWSADVPPVYIRVDQNGVRVEDWGTGIPLDVAMSSLLIPSSSSKGLVAVATPSDRPKVVVIKEKDDLSGLVILVNNVVVFRYYDPDGHYLFKVMLPSSTKVTVARDDVILDPDVQETIANSFVTMPLQEWVIWDMETALRGYGSARPAKSRFVHMILSRVYRKHGDRLVTNIQRLWLERMFPHYVFYRAHQTNEWSVEQRIRQLANDPNNLDTTGAFIHNEPSLDDNGTLVLAYTSSVTRDLTSRAGMTSVIFVSSNDKSKLTKLLMNGRETGLDKDVVDRSEELRTRFTNENINTILHTPLLKIITQIAYGRNRFYRCPREPEECCEHVCNLQKIYGPDRTLKILNAVMGQVVRITGAWGYTQIRPLLIDNRFIEAMTYVRISERRLRRTQKNHDVLVYQTIMHDQRDRYDMELLPVLLPAQYAYAMCYDGIDRKLAIFILDTVYGIESLPLRCQILYAHVLICTFADRERTTREAAYRGIGIDIPAFKKDRVVLVKPNDRLRMLIEEHAHAFVNAPDWVYTKFPVDIDTGHNYNYVTQGIDNRTMRILTRAALLGLDALEWSVQEPLFPPLRDSAPHFTTNDLVSQVLLEPTTCAVSMFDNRSPPVSPSSQQHTLQLVPIVTEYGNTRPFVDAVTIELLQNAIDAIRSIPSTHAPRATVHVKIGIVNIITGSRDRSVLSEKAIEFVVSDPVGMDVETLMSLYVPFFSNKQSQDVGVTGEMGTGFFNVFRESARVVVHTSCSGERAYRVDSRPVRVHGRINDIAHHVSHPPRNRGTDIALYIPIAGGSTNVHIQRLLFEYQRRIIEIACASTAVPIVVNGKRVVAGTSSTLGYVVTNGVPLATIRDLLPTLGFHPILASVLSHSRHIELVKGEYESRQSRETVTLKNPEAFTDDIYFRLYEYLLDFMVGNNFYGRNVWIDGRAFAIDVPDINSNADIAQVLPRIEPLGTLSPTGNHLFDSNQPYGTLRHFFINFVSSPQVPSITQLLHALYRKYKRSSVVFKNDRAKITQFVQEHFTETSCTFTNDAMRSNMIRLLVEWFHGKKTRGVRDRNIVSRTSDCASVVDNTDRLHVIFSSFIQTYARLGHAAGVKHLDEITTNRIKIELGKGVTKTKTCNTSYFSKQKNKIFFAMGAFTDEMIDTFCDRVMEWSRSNDETQTYCPVWENALNCEIFRQYMLPGKRGSGATIPHEIEHVRRMMSSDVFSDGGIHGVQSEVLFTGDVARRREYGCQVNEVYVHLIERCDFITEWKKTLLFSLA